MSENEPIEAERRTDRRFRLSPVWLVPLAVALIGGWLVYQHLISRGPTVILEAETAEGLEAGKTPVKVRSVQVGHVESVRLSEDYSGAIIKLQMNPGTAGLLVEDSLFWVVKPRIGQRGISGLDTILSGAYVQIRPGDSEQPERRFEMLDGPPVSPGDVPGVSIVLTSKGRASVSIGDPIVYLGQKVGRIETAQYQIDADRMRYTAFIKSPFDDLIRTNTQFWIRSGIDFRITSEGVQVQVGSLESIVSGGLTFGVLGDVPPGEPVADGTRFTIYGSRNAAKQERFDQAIKYVVRFRGSVRGLSAGAPVEFKGIRFGTVEQVPFYPEDFSFNQIDNFRVPVLISFEPQRLGPAWSGRTLAEWRKTMQQMFRQGLRATVRPANLLTGAMFIDLQFVDSDTGYDPAKVSGFPVFPSQKSGLANLTQKITSLVNTLNNLELSEAVDELTGTLAVAQGTLQQMESTLASLDRLLSSPDVRTLPDELHQTLQAIQATLSSLGGGHATVDRLNEALRRLNGLLEDLAPAVRTLRQNPASLLFGKDVEPDPVPEADP